VPEDLVAFGDGVLFSADDGATGREPWRADAASGAVRVADVRPGVAGSRPTDLVVAGDLAFFTGATSDVDGAQLWATDGTDAGTYPVGDMKGAYGPGSDVRLGPTAVIGGTLFFVTAVDDGRGAALWRSDGTEDGTELVADLKPYPCSAEFPAMVAMGDRLMLVARSPGSDDELWVSDGTTPGTRMVKDIFPGYPGGRPGSLAVAGDVLFFAAHDGLHGRELWRSDGTEQGTVLVRDILAPGTFDGVLEYPPPIAQGSQVLFAATDYTIWTSDGTFDGTSPLGRSAGLAATWAWETGGAAAVEAFDVAGAGNGGLWRYDGTTLAKAVDYGAVAPRVTAVRELGDALYYTTHAPSLNGGQLLRSVTGTTTPLLLRSFSSWYPYPGDGARVRDRLYFSAGDHATGSELWVTDGTVAGTVLVKDVAPGPRSAVFNGGVLGNLGRRVLFAADDGLQGSELWRTDGTPAGTQLVRDIQPGPDWSGPYGGGRLGGALLFAARDASGTELWRSDGTEGGTFRVKDIVPGPGSSWPSGFVRLGDVLLFAASHPDGDLELWRTDGTELGTWLLADRQPGSGNDGIHPVTVVGDVAYFRVATPNHSFELWVTDGTVAGTRRAAAVGAGGPGGGVKSLENRAGQLFFVANDGVHGHELWALTCGNGVLDALEQCDQGTQNGSLAGCCTGLCAIRPGMEEACDPIEGSLDVRRARVQHDAPGGAASGRVTVDGLLEADAALPLSLDAGLTAFVEDRAGFATRTDWSPAECARRANDVLRCARPGAVATFRPVPGGAAAARRYRFTLNVGGLDVTGPLGPSLAVKLRTGDRLDRAAVLEDCVVRRAALVCRP
jgi:ELWxxDGT repeat protein